MKETAKDNLLRSWKEIAAYLECTVRTCHRWEDQRGMPVHRDEAGETKSPVFAYKDELDAWFKETFRTANGTAKSGKKDSPRLKWIVAGAAVLIVAAALLAWSGILGKGQPADFAIEGSVFIAKDKLGRELLRKDTGMEDLKPEAYYRRNFQIKHSHDYIFPVLVMKDINDDGDREVLFVPRRETDQTGEGILYCYDRRGTELWNFPAGKELVCDGTVHSPDYRIPGIYVHDIEGDGRLEIFVMAWHAPQWPSLLTVLDASGNRVGEFWNAGRIKDFVFHDLTGDGRDELIVVGVNNEYQGGFLAVFDPRHISGGSPQTGRFLCDGLGPGSMLYYVTVPYLDVARAMSYRLAGLVSVETTKNDRIRAIQELGLIYEFGFDLAALQIQTSHTYENFHEDMAEAGRISSVLDDAHLAALLSEVRWWTGSVWASEPSLVLR